MKVAVYSTRAYERAPLEHANTARHQLTFLEPRLTRETAALAAGSEAVCLRE